MNYTFDSQRERTACFSGHRFLGEGVEEAPALLEAELRRLIGEGFAYFGSGGALGFDTLAAEAVLRLRREHTHIKLILILPCRNHTARWAAADRLRFERILKRANKVVYVSEEYYEGCTLARNRYMVERSSACVCWLERPSGGTAYTVNYARSRGLEIINLAKRA